MYCTMNISLYGKKIMCRWQRGAANWEEVRDVTSHVTHADAFRTKHAIQELSDMFIVKYILC